MIKDEGGYSEESRQNRKRLLYKWDPTGGYDIVNWLASEIFKNQSKGEENEYYKAYLGLDNNVPKMNERAKTEWDDKIEKEKKDNKEYLSDFYGTTPRMDVVILAMSDTLNTGKILRDYDTYKKNNPNLPSKQDIKTIYESGKQVLENPYKWNPINGDVSIYNTYDEELSESNPLGMLANFGMKWNPKEKALYVHDTYDFTWPARLATGIPKRPKEMKIRGRINFDPKKGSLLLRNNLKNYNNLPKAVVSNDYL